MATTVKCTNTINNALLQLAYSASPAITELLAANANYETVLTEFTVCSDDTAAAIFGLYYTKGGTDYLIETFTVPAYSGTKSDGTVRAFDVLALLSSRNDNAFNKVKKVGKATAIKVKQVTIGSGKTLTFNLGYELYD